ncbi:uncharacterized protein A1O5_08292 [Cladophialophora psammophila CBS 110553]|uniref:AAA+ ATPase domain-containing protein n=1 Tax=Cladophialophora psammophila CBS 110553 TaxID=1182543 RepID=W9XDK4_9EURO|nr:uncharacterized protein A1O5_08292 [Cladophialophora psammophila CBS 110553]EXJ68499.1 hypothetical protein A1O5_08292 [Cladophialophora psammophila CBS 110553]
MPKNYANATQSNKNPAIAVPPAGSTEGSECSTSLDDYLDIRDQVAGAFLTDGSGKLDPTQLGLLLHAKSLGSVEYTQYLMEYLAVDLRCDFLSLDLPALENLGLVFHDQDVKSAEGEAAKKEDTTEVDVQAAQELEAMESSGAVDNMLEETENGIHTSTENGSSQGGDLDESDEMPGWLKDINLCSDGDSDIAVESMHPDDSADSSSDMMFRDSYDSPCDSPAEEEKETADTDEKYCMAKFYFGTAKPKIFPSTAEQQERNKMALDAVFHAYSAADKQSTGVPTDRSPPLIIYVRDAVRICDLDWGHRLLARLRDRVIERRKSNMPTFVILLCISEDSSRSYRQESWKAKVKKKSGATECLALPIKNIDKDQLKQWEAMYNDYLEKQDAKLTSQLNVRGLKQALKELYPHLVSEELVGNDITWDWKGSGNVGSFLNSEVLSKGAVNGLARTIGGRAWGKPAIQLEDVVAVLNRKESIRDRGNEEDSRTGGSNGDSKEDPRLANLSSYEETLKEYVIKPGQSPITYDDIIMDPAAKATIRQLIAISKSTPTASSSSILEHLKISGVLFYGPPGTGKTHLCRAIANDSGHSLIALSAAELNSKCVGETEKLIKALFSLARKLYPSIIFLDEADSLFYRRASDDKSWQRSATNQYLMEMDGLASNSDNKTPLAIVATNRPKDLDEAFLRRLPHKVYFKLPSREERKQILNLFLAKEDLDADVSIRALVNRTKAFSGSDLKNMCSQAALAWVSEEVQKEGELTQKQVKLAMRHFDSALERTGPSTSPELLEGLMNFSERVRT